MTTLTETYEAVLKLPQKREAYCIKHGSCSIEILVGEETMCNYALHCETKKFKEAMGEFDAIKQEGRFSFRGLNLE